MTTFSLLKSYSCVTNLVDLLCAGPLCATKIALPQRNPFDYYVTSSTDITHDIKHIWQVA